MAEPLTENASQPPGMPSQTGFVLREAGTGELDLLTAMEAACFAQPWNRENILGELESNPFSHAWLLADETGQPAGHAFLWETFETAQIARIGILPEYRRKGCGLFFVELLKKRAAGQGCEFLTLEVRAGNRAARNLYEKAGLIQTGVTRNYYSDGEDAVLMAMPLESEETTCL